MGIGWRGSYLFVFFAIASLGLAGCKSDGGTGSTSSTGDGLCMSNCPKSCDSDPDCDTANGQMCCNFGAGMKTCVEPESCPRFCEADTDCNSDNGEACCRTGLDTQEKVCSKPQKCIDFCSENEDCAEDTVCCTTYAQSICVAPNKCPVECSNSEGCQSEKGEFCCKSLGEFELILGITAACYPKGATCPTSCTATSDCDIQSGEICCDGTCAKSCKRKCEENTDCDMSAGQLCCRNAVVTSSWWAGSPSLFSYPAIGGDCCSYSNPCNWDNDGTCDCGGDYSWDSIDCSGLSI